MSTLSEFDSWIGALTQNPCWWDKKSRRSRIPTENIWIINTYHLSPDSVRLPQTHKVKHLRLHPPHTFAAKKQKKKTNNYLYVLVIAFHELRRRSKTALCVPTSHRCFCAILLLVGGDCCDYRSECAFTLIVFLSRHPVVKAHVDVFDGWINYFCWYIRIFSSNSCTLLRVCVRARVWIY